MYAGEWYIDVVHGADCGGELKQGSGNGVGRGVFIDCRGPGRCDGVYAPAARVVVNEKQSTLFF